MGLYNLKLEVTASAQIPLWWVSVELSPTQTLQLRSTEFAVEPKTSFLIWNQNINVSGPVLNITLTIGQSLPGLGASCLVTVNGQFDHHSLDCQEGKNPTDEWNYVLPVPLAAPVVQA
jgi:hypothetical protein